MVDGPTRPNAWGLLVPVVALAAGLLFAATATTADGTDLRSGRRDRLADLIRVEQTRGGALEAQARRLRDLVQEETAGQARNDEAVAGAQAVAERLAANAAVTPVVGPGLVVALDDAPRSQQSSARLNGATPDDLIVHQQDVEAVLNALWAGGAEAVTVMGDRITATSAVRCVGNTLLLHGRVYSPPFLLAAIGDVTRMQAALLDSPGVSLFLAAADAYGLGFRATEQSTMHLPGYTGPLELTQARPEPTATPGD